MKAKIILPLAVAAITLSACNGYTYLRDGTQRNADGTYGYYAGTCTLAATVAPTTWFSPAICLVHHDGIETVVSGESAMGVSAGMAYGLGSMASGAGMMMPWRGYQPSTIQVSASAPTHVAGNGPVNVTANGGSSSSSSVSRARGGNGGSATASANPVTTVSNSTRNLNRISLQQSNLQIANQRQNNSQTQWQGACSGKVGGLCVDP